MIKKNTALTKVLKWFGGIALVVLVVLGGAALYFSAQWKPLLTKKIKEGVYNGSKHLYKIDFKDIHLNLLSGSASLDQVTLVADTAVYETLKKAKLAPAHLIQVNLSELQFSRVAILTAYFKKKLDINAITLKKPLIKIMYNKVEKKADTTVDETTLFEQISKTFKSIRVRRLNMVDAKLAYINGANGRRQNAVKSLNVTVDDFFLDSLSQKDTTRIYYTKEIAFELIGYQSLSKDRMYNLKADTITGSARGKILHINGFHMIPMYGELAFSRKHKTQKDRYDLHFQKMDFRGIDFVKLNQEGRLHAQSLTLGPAKVAIFMNRELPPPPIDKGLNYPHIALKRLPLSLHLDTIRLKSIDVAYTEYNPISQKRGTVDLQNLKGTLLNVTNDSLQLTKNNHAIARLSTHIIKAATVNVNLDFNLTAKDGSFSCSGNVGPMDMTALNPLSRSLGLVKIEEGKVRKASFNFKGNLKGSNGTMRFYYHNLKVTLLKEGEDGNPMQEKGLLSFLANTILIKDSNPGRDQELRVANISFQRTPAASFFNLLWKSVFVGIRETIGIGMVPVKSPEEKYEKVVDKKEERRQKRQDKKEERIKKRAKKAEAKAREEGV